MQLHFGGGSPVFFAPTKSVALGEIIHKHFTFSRTSRASVEVDPRWLTRANTCGIAEIGFTASMGVQDFNPKVQRRSTASSRAR